MAKSRSTIRTQVRAYLDESTAADWSNTELDTLINTNYHKVYTAVQTVYEDYYLTTGNITTVANQQQYTLPTDFFKLRRVEINYDVSAANGAAQRALPVPLDAVRRDLGQANLGVHIFTNPHYYIFQATIGFIPIPDKAGTNAIQLWYIATVSDMSSDSDTITIPYPDRYWHLIAEGATADALRFGQQDSPEADKFDRKMERGIALMQEELEDRIAEESKSVIDVSGEFIDFSV